LPFDRLGALKRARDQAPLSAPLFNFLTPNGKHFLRCNARTPLLKKIAPRMSPNDGFFSCAFLHRFLSQRGLQVTLSPLQFSSPSLFLRFVVPHVFTFAYPQHRIRPLWRLVSASLIQPGRFFSCFLTEFELAHLLCYPPPD